MQSRGHPVTAPQPSPRCPKCDKPLTRVVQESNSPLNRDQWESTIAGNLFCTCHNNFRGNKPYAYFWDHEVAPVAEEKPRPPGIVKNRTVEGGKEFWDHVEDVAKNVQPLAGETQVGAPQECRCHFSDDRGCPVHPQAEVGAQPPADPRECLCFAHDILVAIKYPPSQFGYVKDVLAKFLAARGASSPAPMQVCAHDKMLIEPCEPCGRESLDIDGDRIVAERAGAPTGEGAQNDANASPDNADMPTGSRGPKSVEVLDQASAVVPSGGAPELEPCIMKLAMIVVDSILEANNPDRERLIDFAAKHLSEYAASSNAQLQQRHDKALRTIMEAFVEAQSDNRCLTAENIGLEKSVSTLKGELREAREVEKARVKHISQLTTERDAALDKVEGTN